MLEVAPYFIRRGGSPLIISFPHSGETLGPVADRMTEAARKMPDTDWHLLRLYDFLDDMDVTVIKANYNRYVIDLNRDPSGESLYPGQNVTELCPTTTFDEGAVYQPGEEPDDDEIKARREQYHAPYHGVIAEEIERIRQLHGRAVLFDAHSIAARVPRFFDGELPHFNLGTADGKTCSSDLEQRLLSVCEASSDYSSVLNGRFKGGYITRAYGDPDAGVNAVQLELSQATYLHDEIPFLFDEEKAEAVRPLLEKLVGEMLVA